MCITSIHRYCKLPMSNFACTRKARLSYLSRRSRMKTKPQSLCSNCESGHLHKDVRNVKVTRKELSTTVKNIAGLFCDNCDEIEFDASTDSAERYAAAGDKLVLQNQAQAALLTGGGHNAFSRYESGAAQAVPAVYNLFSILDKHPEILKEFNV